MNIDRPLPEDKMSPGDRVLAAHKELRAKEAAETAVKQPKAIPEPPASVFRNSALKIAIDAGLQNHYNADGQAINDVDKLIEGAVKIERYLKEGKKDAEAVPSKAD